MSWLSPTDIQLNFKVSKTTAYKLLKEFEDEHPDQVVKLGKELRRVPEESFVDFLKQRKA